MSTKYIIFRAESSEEHGVDERILPHNGGLTDILAEHFDCSNEPLPSPGYRFPEFQRIEEFVDPRFPGASTHYRTGDWEVSKVDVYETKTEGAEFDVIAICWCKYSPINSPLKQLPEIQIHQDLQEV